MFMEGDGALGSGEAQTAAIALMRETLPGKLNVSFTRGYVSRRRSSQLRTRPRALHAHPDGSHKGLEFKATHKKANEAHEWMGFEARSVIHELLDEATKKKADVRVIAYDLNLPEILTRLEKLKARLKVIVDDSDSKGTDLARKQVRRTAQEVGRHGQR